MARWTGPRREPPCSRSAASSRSIGRRACSTASTASPGSGHTAMMRFPPPSDWLAQASFEVESLESGLAIGAGTPQAIQGVEGVSISSDGTSVAEQPLQTGDEYSVVAYVPQP